MYFSSSMLLALLPAAAWGWDAPSYSGWSRLWQEPFAGSAGAGVNTNTWNIITGLRVNNELQDYTTSRNNLQISGGGTVQIVPRLSGGQWTSARIESKPTFTPANGRVTRIEGHVRFGDNPTSNKKGMWPAFWALGDAIRNGVDWPECGEIDILETVNGILTGHGTIHCGTYPGGPCNEPNGIGNSIGIPNQEWQTWRVEIDRRPSAWQDQRITWFMNGQQFHQVSGSTVGSQSVWSRLAHSPLYVILNMAVGGDWPGNPDGNTRDGYGSMLEAAYVAVYQSS